MTNKEAISRILDHMRVHNIGEPPHVYIGEALLMGIEALYKQDIKKPIHIHEEYPEHLWQRDKNGEIDLWAFEAGYCNGPMCTRCYHVECEHCNEDWETDPTEPCVISKDICPTCGASIGKNKYCSSCGQALDWSD